jgi:sterol 3beta-glucosyltransferase
MRLLLISVGTRGDIEPFIAIGEILAKNGHKIYYAFPAQLCYLVQDKTNCFPLTKDFIEMIESPEGRSVMTGEGGFLKRVSNFYKVYKKGMQINKTLVEEQKQLCGEIKPDRIIYHPKCSYPIVYGIQNNKKNIMASPVPYILHTHDEHPALGFGSSKWIWWNRLSYRIGNIGIVKALKMSTTSIEGYKKITSQQIINHLRAERFVYLVSPNLYNGPTNPPAWVKVLGFHEKASQNDWAPDEKLWAFLNSHRKVLMLTFGSMINTRPEYTTRVFLEIFSRLQIPAIVIFGFGGLVVPEDFKDNPFFYFTQQLPYHKVLPKIYAVIHHGGAGTTQSGLRYGCATLIIPHLIDQFMWNQMMFDLGVGPKGIAIKDISVEKLLPLVQGLWEHPTYKEKAKVLSIKMKNEDLKEDLYQFLTQSFT